MELDLHGEKHQDVDRIVENFILSNNTPMTIITGNSEMMRDLVIKALSRHLYDWICYSHNAGMLTVVEGDNRGKL